MIDKLAQSIAESAHEVIGYHVLVTDKEGTIIGSDERARIGTPHAPSREVIARGESVSTDRDEAARLVGVKPGYTAPICFGGGVIGTISIAGPPARVGRYGLLVRKQAEIMLKEQALLEVEIKKEQALRELTDGFIAEVANESERDMLVLRAQTLGFRPHWWRKALLLQTSQGASDSLPLQTARAHFGPDSLVSALPDSKISIFVTEYRASDESVYSFMDKLKELGVTAWAGVGGDGKAPGELSRSAGEAASALSVGRQLSSPASGAVYHARDLKPEILLSGVGRKRRQEYLESVEIDKLGDELAASFLAWCENPFAPARIAAELGVHRNTLNYRLNRIRDILGIERWDLGSAFTVWSALILKKLK